MDFFIATNLHLYIGIVLSCVNGVLMCLLASKFLHVIQLSGYKIVGYRAYLKETKWSYVTRLVVLCFMSALCVLVTNSLLDGYGEYYSYIGLIFYFYFCTVFIINVYRAPQKTPLKQTHRMQRLTFVVFLLMSALTFVLIMLFSEYVPFVRFGVVAITPIFLPVIVPLAHFICIPMENTFRQVYKRRAKKKLASMPNLIKIGITGSYGKTTTKHILNVMLSTRYCVCMSPHSFNTPMGLTKVINNYLETNHEILIAEMGARQVGDIAYLCNLIHPKHAIITGVGNQHLATFGTLDNIYKAKKELVDAIEDGYICFNAQNEGSLKMYNECTKDKYLCGIDGDYFVSISNIKASSKGSTFDLKIDNECVSCTTKLLGKSNLEDIALAAGLAYKLGISPLGIKNAISILKPIPHRTELIEENGLTIIDDSFNASVESSRNALETLALFEGEKIVVTPGLVELGDSEYAENVAFGESIAKVANKVIIVNKTNQQALMTGLLKSGFDENNILEVETLNDAKQKLKDILSGGEIVLFENDLPDNYI